MFGGYTMITSSMKGCSVFNRPTIFTMLLTFTCIGLAVFLVSGCGKEKRTEMPPTVEVADVVQKDVPIFAEWVGTLDGMVNATIRAQVQGYLIKQNYKEGDPVKTGQVLFEIDPRTFQAALDQAKGELGRTEARWNQTKANLARIKPLAAQNAVSQKDLDDAIAAEQSAQASMQSAKATFDKASLELGFTKITSPIDGIAGIAKAQIGNLVGPGGTEELTTVSTVNPIKAYVSVSEQEYMQAQETRKRQVGKVPLELILADGSDLPPQRRVCLCRPTGGCEDRHHQGGNHFFRIRTISSGPDSLRESAPRWDSKKGALLIPQRAVTRDPGTVPGGGQWCPENKVAIKQVKAGERFGQLWVIDEGLQAGDKVVAEGIQKVRDGMVVSPKPFESQPQAKPEAGQKPEAKPEGPKNQSKSSGPAQTRKEVSRHG